MRSTKKCIIYLFICTIVILTGCSDNELMEENKQKVEMFKNDTLLIKFRNDFPEAEVLLCDKADVTSDNIDDMVVIYRNNGSTYMRVIIGGESIIYTEEIAAPVENQSIEFKDIDQKNELEFIIRGSNKGSIGYAIYRVINNEIINLFGEGMENCC